MTASDILNHLEWLIGGAGIVAVFAFGALYWVWNYSATQLDVQIQRIENAFDKADSEIKEDIKGVRDQVTAFQTDMYTKDMGGALEARIFTRIDRFEDKIDDRMDRLGEKIDEALRPRA